MAEVKPKFNSRMLAVIRRAKHKLASDQEWQKLRRAGGAVKLSDGRWCMTIPAIDALAEWNRQHRRAIEDRIADTRKAGDGEVRS